MRMATTRNHALSTNVAIAREHLHWRVRSSHRNDFTPKKAVSIDIAGVRGARGLAQ